LDDILLATRGVLDGVVEEEIIILHLQPFRRRISELANVCVHLCMCAFMYVCIYVCVHLCMCAFISYTPSVRRIANTQTQILAVVIVM
jgi:hypothetical protein